MLSLVRIPLIRSNTVSILTHCFCPNRKCPVGYGKRLWPWLKTTSTSVLESRGRLPASQPRPCAAWQRSWSSSTDPNYSLCHTVSCLPATRARSRAPACAASWPCWWRMENWTGGESSHCSPSLVLSPPRCSPEKVEWKAAGGWQRPSLITWEERRVTGYWRMEDGWGLI